MHPVSTVSLNICLIVQMQVGIVGLPNVGKSTLYNTLTKCSIPAENFPFCTIDPNEVYTASSTPMIYLLLASRKQPGSSTRCCCSSPSPHQAQAEGERGRVCAFPVADPRACAGRALRLARGQVQAQERGAAVARDRRHCGPGQGRRAGAAPRRRIRTHVAHRRVTGPLGGRGRVWATPSSRTSGAAPANRRAARKGTVVRRAGRARACALVLCCVCVHVRLRVRARMCVAHSGHARKGSKMRRIGPGPHQATPRRARP